MAKEKGEGKPPKEAKPPEETSLVKELLLSPQLYAAILCAGAFAFTVVQPMKMPKLNPPGLKTDPPSALVVDIDNDKIFEKIDAVPAMALLKKGDKEKAIAAAVEIGKSREKRKDPVQLLAAGSVLLISDQPIHRWKGNLLIDKALKIAPKSRYVRLLHARELYKQGRMDDAIADYEACLNLSPADWVTPRLELANVFMMNEQGKKSIEMFKEVLELKPDDPRILKRYGIAMAVNSDQQGGFDKFIEGSNLEYDKPDYSPEVQEMVDKHAGLIEDAITAARADVDKNPEDIHKRVNLARLLIGVNRLKQAKDQLDQASKRLEANPEIHEVLAECHNRMKQTDLALAEFATTARLEPLNKPAAASDQYSYLPTWDDLHEEEVLEKPPEKTATN